MPVFIDPLIRNNGSFSNTRGATKRTIVSNMNEGYKNPHHYVDGTAISDGVTDARTAIAAADADGPIVLPPGTYAIASNLTITNSVKFEPGAKIKPANAVVVTLNGGYSAEDTQHVFNISAGGSVSVPARAVGYFTPQHFGAIAYLGDSMGAAVDSTAAFNAAIVNAASQFDANSMRDAGIVRVPSGAYSIASSISITSGVHLLGAGASTELVKAAAWTGSTIAIQMKGGTNSLCSEVVIDGFQFIGAFTAIECTTSTSGYEARVTSCKIRNLVFDCPYGVLLNSLAINNEITSLFSHGTTNPLQQILDLRGNANRVSKVTVEGNAGTNVDPILLIKSWAYIDAGGPFSGVSLSNHIEDILIEGGGNANKIPAVFDGVSRSIILNMYCETIAAATYALSIINCDDLKIAGAMYLVGLKINITNSKYTIFERVDLSGEGLDTLDQLFDITNGNVHIENLIGYTSQDTYRVADMQNISVERFYGRLLAVNAPAGVVNLRKLNYSLGNSLLVNSAFSSAGYGWTVQSTGTSTYSNLGISPIGAGSVLSLVNNLATESSSVHQDITIGTEQIGHPITVSAVVNAVSGNSSSGYMCPFVQGCGVVLNASSYDTARVGSGWVVVSTVVIPQSAGVMSVGVQGVLLTVGKVACISCAPGNTATSFFPAFQEVSISGKTIRYANAAPSTGRGTLGDYVFNSEYAAQEPIGWLCTTNNSPGTWLADYPGTGPEGAAVFGSLNINTLNWINFSGNNYLSGITYFRDGAGVTNGSMNGTNGALVINGPFTQRPAASTTPAVNGDLQIEATSNTTLTFKLKGSDGTVRSGTITLSP